MLAAVAVTAVMCGDSPTRVEPPVQQCGGIAGGRCPGGQFCELPENECQSADLFGECIRVPEVCTEEFVPVCGCDGVTYGNDCKRRMAQVQKGRNGEC